MESFIDKTVDKNIFERERNNKLDLKLKIKVLNKYNELKERFSDKFLNEFDVSIVSDILLDTLKYETMTIIDVEKALLDL